MTLMIVSTSLVTAILGVCYRKRHAGNCGPMWYKLIKTFSTRKLVGYRI